MGKRNEEHLGAAAEERVRGHGDMDLGGPKNIFPLTDPEHCLRQHLQG